MTRKGPEPGQRRDGLIGERGLLIAVIEQAASDLQRQAWRADARQYFESSAYKTHLQLLGLREDLRPVTLHDVTCHDGGDIWRTK